VSKQRQARAIRRGAIYAARKWQAKNQTPAFPLEGPHPRRRGVLKLAGVPWPAWLLFLGALLFARQCHAAELHHLLESVGVGGGLAFLVCSGAFALCELALVLVRLWDSWCLRCARRDYGKDRQ
jgi:hypothetical protein